MVFTTTDLKKTVSDATPVYAVVGVTDLAAERLRAARTQAAAAGKTITAVDPKAVQKDVTASAEKALKQVQDVPAVVLERGLELAGKAQQQYGAFAARGEELVKKIRTQKSTQDLVAQAEQTVALGKGAVTTVRKAVSDTQASAKATITTGRHQAVRVAGVVTDVVSREVKDADAAADVIADAIQDGGAKTATAAKRTRTIARKGAKATTARTKAATTSARKTAPQARKASAAAAGKVGA
jgi:heparin binding hemagglutinin HbhA